MPTLWAMSIIILWAIVLVEMCLLLLLLHALGELRTQGFGSSHQKQTSASDLGGLEIGEIAPLFVALNQHGQEIKLADFRGMYCILAFVSAGCKSCDGTAGALQSLHHENPDTSVLFVGTPLAQRNIEYSARHQLRFPLLTPTSDQIQKLYRVRSVPFVFVLDNLGVIRAKGVVSEVEHARSLLHLASAQANHPI